MNGAKTRPNEISTTTAAAALAVLPTQLAKLQLRAASKIVSRRHMAATSRVVPNLIKFQQLVTIANRVAAEFNGSRDTCVLTSFALHDVLQRLGCTSRPLRIEAAVFPDDRKLYGTILGGFSEPGRRQAASPGMWHGHLAVVVDDSWLLDATLDQANKEEWPRAIHVGPLAVRLTEHFWAERGSILVRTNGCTVRFSPHPRQVGFANAGDARPSHWKPLADRILHAVQQAGDPALTMK